jgi:hypothetical protein
MCQNHRLDRFMTLLCIKEGPPIQKETRVYADSGYQELDKLHPQTELPYKKTKTRNLDAEEKEYNRALSRYRVLKTLSEF